MKKNVINTGFEENLARNILDSYKDLKENLLSFIGKHVPEKGIKLTKQEITEEELRIDFTDHFTGEVSRMTVTKIFPGRVEGKDDYGNEIKRCSLSPDVNTDGLYDIVRFLYYFRPGVARHAASSENADATFAGLHIAGANLIFKDGKFAIAGDWKQNSYVKTCGKKEGSTYFNCHEAMSANVDGWRLPTRDEWKAIIGTDRTGSLYNGQSVAHFALIQVYVTHGRRNVCNGLLLFPDRKRINGIEISNIDQTSEQNEYQQTKRITEEDLNALLSQGCVFLPASGFCVDGDDWYDGDTCGTYWSSTEYNNTSYAYNLDFNDRNLFADNFDDECDYYYSVRLVRG